MSEVVLELHGVSKRFGGVQALMDISLTGRAGEVHGIIGPNGAGKSTLVGCITGINRIDAGRIVLRGNRIEELSAYRRARLRMARTFQKIRLANDLTVFENVALGLASAKGNGGFVSRLFSPLGGSEIGQVVGRALEAAGVADIAADRVSGLPYGRRHFVELARVLVSDPAVVLLDEPATGLTSEERERLRSLIRQMASEGRLVMLIEHDLDLVGRLCDVVSVINYGQCIFTGTPAEAQADAGVIKAYLGSNRLAAEEGKPRVRS